MTCRHVVMPGVGTAIVCSRERKPARGTATSYHRGKRDGYQDKHRCDLLPIDIRHAAHREAYRRGYAEAWAERALIIAAGRMLAGGEA